jgi:hypothetical protein
VEIEMTPIRVATVVAGAVATALTNPTVRAALRNAPRLVTPRMREMAAEATLETAFRAGVLARKIVRRA